MRGRPKRRRYLVSCGCVLLGCCLGGPGAVRAAHEEIYSLSLEKLAEVVVTDSKIAQPRATVTQKLEVIGTNEFGSRATPQRNLAEILRYTAGQFVNPLSRNDANWGSYAGLGPKYNTYLLDGLPIDSFADAMSLDPWALQEVEVHKGPASVLYANYLTMDFAGNEMSLAGITNFILKDRIDFASTRIAVGLGSHNTFDLHFYQQDRRGDFSYFVGGSFERSDYTSYGLAGSWLDMVQSPRYEKTKFYAKMSQSFDDGRQQLSLFVHRADQWGNAGRPNRDFRNRYETVNAVYSHWFDDSWHLQLKSGYRNYDRSWEEDNYPVDLNLLARDGVKQKIYPTDLTVTFQHAGNSMLTMGTDYQSVSYKTVRLANDVRARSSGLYLQEKYVRDGWVFRVGGRINRSNQSYYLIDGVKPAAEDKAWNSQIWSAGMRYNASPRLSLYANVGSSFLVPSAKSVCGTMAAAAAGMPGQNGQLPSPDLRPEKGTGSDFGVEFHPDSSFSLGLRGFVNRINEAIIENVVSAIPSQSQSVNAGRARSEGVEVTVEQVVSRHFKWFANYTHNSTEVRNALVRDQDGTAIPFVPDFVGNAGLVWNLPGDVTIAPCLQTVGDYYDSTSRSGRKQFGSYQVINLRMQSPVFNRRGYAVSCSLDLNNLFDRRYEMPWQFRDPGFNAFLSMECDF